MAQLKRIAGPNVREFAQPYVNWSQPLTTKADVLAWLVTIPAGATVEQSDAAGKQLGRSLGLTSPPDQMR